MLFRVNQRLIAATILIVFSSVFSPMVHAAAGVGDLYYAGFALSGNASDSLRLFPLTTKLLSEKTPEGIPLLEDRLRGLVREANRTENLVFELIEQRQGRNAVAVAFLIDWENIAYEKIDTSTKIVADLHGQILVFDFDTKKALAAFPVAMQIIDVVDGQQTDLHAYNLIRRLFFGSPEGGLLDAFSTRYSTLDIRRSYGNYVGVVDVTLEENALDFLMLNNESVEQYSTKIADQFGKRLSTNLGIPYVPYTKGQAIGGKMVARFSSGAEYQFELPKPDYQIHLTLRGFKKALLDSNSILSAWAYGSYMKVKMTNFDQSHTYLEIPVKYGAVKKVPRTTDQIDDWTIYQESVFSLIDQTTQQLDKPSRKWLDEWSTGKDAFRQINSLKQIIDRSR